LRAHVLQGDEPPGEDGAEPNPLRPMSEANEAAAVATLRRASEAARAEMRELIARGDDDDDGSVDALDPETRARVMARVDADEDWARAVRTLRRGQEDILDAIEAAITTSD
jgi:hypothetical protein